MILFKKADELTKYLRTKSENGLSIGFVPTMGALHEGHIQLIRACKSGAALCVASIFVNPTQFNDPQDFAKYPVTLDTDLLALEQAGCDILFLPGVAEIYSEGTDRLPVYDLGYLETILEGFHRPGHFQGVCQVMDRLLGIVMPDQLFMGKKDYQQCMVVKRLIMLKHWPISLLPVPTVREASGLAMSSRNKRLNEMQKQQAAALYTTLTQIGQSIQPGNLSQLTATATQAILQAGFDKVDYIALCDADTLTPVTNWDGHRSLVALVAAFIGGVRLIDNMPLPGA
ncbi:pantoate--beta-alanine ligase [Sediminibacterium soli]|uniref:pantoate--beta-alanine ligase n=1 Tax=Sediminibacterium soli TaxID=2698829 RepID=UPI001379871B|nr:pantoate--beta-alanine ligase [Sediminibacterium soli]NCI45844.1 pantoate--beta-alanine ligase [Sediminibacterium soli]